MTKARKYYLRKQVNKHLLGLPYYIIIGLFILIPLLIMVAYSFKKDPDASIFPINFTLSNYGLIFSNASFLKAIGESIFLALITTTITLIIAYPLAYFITKQKAQVQSLIVLLISAPMWINMLLRTLALKQLFLMVLPRLLGTRVAVIFGMVHLFLPFMVIPIYTTLVKIDKQYIEAAKDLGANNYQIFTKILFPLSLSGIFSGILMVFLPTATSLVVPAYLGKRKYLIGNVIEAFVKLNGNIALASATTIILSIIMVTMVVVFKVVSRKISKGGKVQNEAV